MADRNEPMSVGGWVITFILQMIPLVGIIMLFVWAFSSNGNESRSNYAKALLIIMLVFIVIAIGLTLMGVSMTPQLPSNM